MKRLFLPLALLLVAVACAEDDDPAPLADSAPPGSAICSFDDSEGPESALDLSVGAATTGALCPIEDTDWYAFSTTQAVISVSLGMDPALSPVEPTYVIRTRDGGAAGDVVATPRPEETGRGLAVTHCAPAGDYFIAVRDQGDDAEDRRANYVLEVREQADPDANEPNGQGAETALAGETTGYLACRGDEDHYVVNVDDRQILDVRITMPIATVEPRMRVLNPGGDVVFDEAFGAAGRMATNLHRAVAVTEGGRWTIVVSDAGDDGEDLDTPYVIAVTTVDQLDTNEPNDTASTATEQDAVECGNAWSEWREVEGTIGTLGDPDWFRIPVSSCGRGLIEAEVDLDAPEDTVQASVALVRPHGPSPCEQDEECRRLTRGCQSDWDCAGFFNTCIEGRCAGATACLQESVCGAFVAERHHTRAAESTPNVAVLAAPIFSGGAVYLRVGDFVGDGAAPDRFYTLRYRLRDDPDRNEPSNLYTPTLSREDPDDIQVEFAIRNNLVAVHDSTDPLVEKGLFDGGVPDSSVDAEVDAGVLDARVPDADPDAEEPDVAVPDVAVPDAAIDVPVPDAAEPDVAVPDVAVPDVAVPDVGPDAAEPDADLDAGVPDAVLDASADGSADMDVERPVLVPGPCGPDDWTEGWISYQADQDWYAYAHPCPGEDCMVRILYEIEAGPVDSLWQVYQGGRLWFDTVVGVEEEAPMQPAMSGAFGGTQAADQCFYAYNGHQMRGDDRFYYTLRIRDLLPGVDWSASQRYRFCVEKVANGCSAPCIQAENGCDAP